MSTRNDALRTKGHRGDACSAWPQLGGYEGSDRYGEGLADKQDGSRAVCARR